MKNYFNRANRFAGTGRENNITSAIHVEGVPPIMESISVLHSVLTGINVTTSDAPVVINNCTVQFNRGKTEAIPSIFSLLNYNILFTVIASSNTL